MSTTMERRKQVAAYLESEFAKWEEDHDESRLESIIALFESNMPQLKDEEDVGGLGTSAFLRPFDSSFPVAYAIHMLEELNNYVLHDKFDPSAYDYTLLMKIRQSLVKTSSLKEIEPQNLVFFLLLVDDRIFQDKRRGIELVSFDLIVEQCLYAVRLRQRYGAWWDL